MDINLLVVSVGNSRIAFGAFVRGTLEHVTRVAVADRDQWAGAIAEAWSKFDGVTDAEVAGACVNPPVLEAIEHAVSSATGKGVAWVGSELEMPIKVKTDRPEKTGVDRALNLAAAYQQMQAACVVVDAGTALTVDVCNDAGEFIGGAILPGATTMLNALAERTAKLPRVELSKPEGLIGRSTEQALLHGVFFGLRGAVKELVENYATELGRWPDVICTGGDAALLFGDWELAHAVSPDLTLYGIALAYAEEGSASA